MKVRNMTSDRTGREVPNQFIITDDEGNRTFQSYHTVIAREVQGEITLNSAWDQSCTTSKYRNAFLGESKKETKAKIKSGEYKIADLNK